MPQPAEHFENGGQTVNVRGRHRPYLECRRIRRRDYFLLERIGSPFRESYLAFDRLAGPGGSFFLVQSLPVGKAAEQLLRVLSRLKSDAFPRVVEWEKQRHQIDVALTWTEGISLADYLQNIRERPQTACRARTGSSTGEWARPCRLSSATSSAGQSWRYPARQRDHHIAPQPPAAHRFWQCLDHRLDHSPHRRRRPPPLLRRPRTSDRRSSDQLWPAISFRCRCCCLNCSPSSLPYGGLGGKAGRPEFIARAADTLVAPSQISSSCQAVTPVTARPTRCIGAAWFGAQPGRPLSGSQHLAQSTGRN